MSSYQGYYVRPCRRTTTPRHVVSIGIRLREVDGKATDGRITHAEWDRGIAVWSSRNRCGWTPPREIVFGDPSALHDWLEGEQWQGKSLYVYARSASDALTLSNLWPRIRVPDAACSRNTIGCASDARSLSASTVYTFSRLSTSRTADTVTYCVGGRRLTWASIRCLIPLSDDAIAEMCGYQWGNVRPGSLEHVPSSSDWHDRAGLYLRAVQWLADWWRSVNGGTWGNSVGTLAGSYLRSRMGERTVCTHRHPEAQELENDASFGGRVSAWFIGDVRPRCDDAGCLPNEPPRSPHRPVDGPVYRVDIRRMYTSILTGRRLPTRLLAVIPSCSVGELRELLKTCCCVARVELDTSDPEYPRRLCDGVSYPVGRFTATLASPCLMRALARGAVRSVLCVAMYQAGCPFSEVSTSQGSAHGTGDQGFHGARSQYAKLLGNSITGRFGMRPRYWTIDRKAKPHVGLHCNGQWGTWLGVRPNPAYRPELATIDPERASPVIVTRYRAIAGVIQRQEVSRVGTGTMQSIYAHITSYGRMMMADIRDLCPPRSVLMQDTDGLWLTEAALTALANRPGLWGELPGKLRLDGTIRSARIYGPKHYWSDGEWTLAGWHDHSYRRVDGVCGYSETTNPIRNTPTGPPSSIAITRRQTILPLVAVHGRLRQDGWIEPYHMPTGQSAVASGTPIESDLLSGVDWSALSPDSDTRPADTPLASVALS